MKIPTPSYESVVVAVIVTLAVLTIITIPKQVQISEQRAIRQLEEAGYTQPEMTGWRPLACSEDDLFRLGFRAIGVNGQPISGVVCSAPFKGATIRLD